MHQQGQGMTETIKISDLQPDNHNANKGTARGRALLEKSLHQYGAGRSILLDKNGRIIAGNKTATTAGEIGIEDVIIVRTDGKQLVAVMREDLDLNDEEARMLAYADNRVGQVDLEWDASEILADMTAGLPLDEFWFEDELQDLFANIEGYEPPGPEPGDAEPQINRAEELREKWQVEPGQLWRLPSRTPGQEHRLICGDCTDTAVVARVMGGEKAVGCVTSPPYALQRKNEYGGVDERDYLNWFEDVQQIIASNIETSGSFFLNIKPHSEGGFRSLYVFDLIVEMCRTWQWGLVDEYCWKSQGTPGEWHNKFKNAFEPIYHFAKTDKVNFYPEHVLVEPKSDLKKLETYGGDGSKWKSTHGSSYNGHGVKSAKYGDKVLPSNVIEAASASVVGQSAAYPESIPAFFVGAFSCAGDVWLEMFCGSGTDLIAAENLARQCRAVEISPAYVAVALDRYERAFGIKPELME